MTTTMMHTGAAMETAAAAETAGPAVGVEISAAHRPVAHRPRVAKWAPTLPARE